MARKPRIELAGGLYHVITRGNNKQKIFHDPADHEKFLALLRKQKQKLPFFLYAYCLMSNHVHLLIERQAHSIGRIMHRLLTGYASYFNRRYQNVGHVLQGRHKAILCQSETYLCELIRYIHLSPVRANIVRRPEEYRYSSHRAYLGLETAGLVDVDPVLRHFGVRRKVARERFKDFVDAAIRQDYRPEFYELEQGRILGNEEFVDEMIHQIGETPRTDRRPARDGEVKAGEFNGQALIVSVETAFGMSREEFCSSSKNPMATAAKEALIMIGRKFGASVRMLAELIGISSSSVTRRHDAAREKLRSNGEAAEILNRIERLYDERN